jgi:hypothetical protein
MGTATRPDTLTADALTQHNWHMHAMPNVAMQSNAHVQQQLLAPHNNAHTPMSHADNWHAQARGHSQDMSGRTQIQHQQYSVGSEHEPAAKRGAPGADPSSSVALTYAVQGAAGSTGELLAWPNVYLSVASVVECEETRVNIWTCG